MRLPDAGRIRIGVKGSKGQPQKLDRFRFTSTDPVALEQVADLYGGQITPWSDPKAGAGQFQVITEAREIRIALPPDPLGNTPIYELWTGGGCARRCDGEVCEMLTSGQDGLDLQQVPCICDAKGELACKVTTRLSVLLPEIRFVGVWRLDTHGWNAAQELPGMVELIRTLQDRGVVRGLLRVEERVQVLAGQTRKYMVPVLGIDESVEALAAGSARLGALGASTPLPELGSGVIEPGAEPPYEGDVQQDPGTPGDSALPLAAACDGTEAPGSADDEIIDAEIVEPIADDAVALLLAVADTGPKKSKALKAARLWAEHKGVVLPGSFDEITDPFLADAALKALI
jgi:hypothetical protein